MSGSAAADDGDGLTDRCPRCLLQRRVCLCAEVPVVATRTRIVIVRHHLERWRSSNSGRLAHLAMPNSEVVDHGGELGLAVLPPLEGGCLLFPQGEPVRVPDPVPRTLVVLDATWSQARRMYRKLEGLRGLPVWRLPEAPPAARMREAPSPDRVSTLEAIAHALRALEGDDVAAPLERLFALAVDRARATGRAIV
jgi:DTW domain-containing protein YfiP